MPNSQVPFGLRWVSSADGAKSPALQEFIISSSNLRPVKVGSVASKTSTDGFYEILDTIPNNSSSYVVSSVFDENGRAVKKLDPGTEGKALGIPLSGQVFAIKVTGNIEVGNTGDVGDITQPDNPSLPGYEYDISQTLLDAITLGTGTQFRVLGLVKEKDNEFGDFANVLVTSVQNIFENQESF